MNSPTAAHQPVIEVKSKKIIALEALIRYPEKGIILPCDFIPIAEENGMILKIGEQVLQIIGEHYEKWKKLNIPDIDIAVNISPKQLQHSNFIRTLKYILEEYDKNELFRIRDLRALSSFISMVKTIDLSRPGIRLYEFMEEIKLIKELTIAVLLVISTSLLTGCLNNSSKDVKNGEESNYGEILN